MPAPVPPARLVGGFLVTVLEKHMKTRLGLGLMVAVAIGCSTGTEPQLQTKSSSTTPSTPVDGSKLTLVTLKLPAMT